MDAARVTYLTGTLTGAMRVGGGSLTSAGQQDAFLAKLNLFGIPVWARALGGTGHDAAPGVTVYYPGGTVPVVVAGTYENHLTLGLTALNAVGGSDVFVTSIEADPRIVTQPQSVAVPFGGTASFSAVAGGTGPFFFQWRHDGTNIPGAVSGSLGVADGPHHERGQLRCAGLRRPDDDPELRGGAVCEQPAVHHR